MCDYKGNNILRKSVPFKYAGKDVGNYIIFVCPECEESICLFCGSHEPAVEKETSDGFFSVCPDCGRETC